MKNRSVSNLVCLMVLLMAWMISPIETWAQETVHDKVDEMPVPPGGMDGLIKHMSQELKYPKEAKKAGIEGTVMLTFVVRSDGTVEAVNVLLGIGGGCDQEAVRVVKSSGKWTAGRLDGQPVNTQITLPIQFKL